MDGVVTDGASEAEQGQDVSILGSRGIWFPIILELADSISESRIAYVIFCAGGLGYHSNESRSNSE